MGKANVILDNLIAQGNAKPMIVVMPFGYGTMEMIARGWSAWRDADLPSRNFAKFSDALLQEVIPLVKQQYPLSDKVGSAPALSVSWPAQRSLTSRPTDSPSRLKRPSTSEAPTVCCLHRRIRDRGSTFSSHLPGGAIQFPGGSFFPLWTSALHGALKPS
jgi:hypothetical protein